MTITKEGALASFYTVNKAPIKHLRVYFSPKQAGSGTASPENVREIEGWNQLYFSHSQKGLVEFGGVGPYNYYFNGYNAQWIKTPQQIVPVTDRSQYYTYSCYIDNTNGTATSQVQVWFKDITNTKYLHVNAGSAIPVGTTGRSFVTFKPSSNDYYLGLGISLKEGAIASNGMLEIGNTMTEYESYKGSLQTIDWSNDIGTVYGGYIDLITGELVTQYGFFSTTWGAGLNNAVLGDNERRGFYSPSIIFDTSSNLHANGQGPYQAVKTTMCNAAFWAWDYNSDTTHYYINEHDINVMLPVGTDNNLVLNFCAKLKTPQTVATLTPTELQTFIGRNNIWSNADRIEVEYDLAESNDELYRRRNILLQGAPHLETATGNVANFKTDIIAQIKEAKVYFEPKQLGSGDPSPSNVREIRGWDEFNIHQMGKNLIDTSKLITGRVWWNGGYSYGWANNAVTELISIRPGVTYRLNRNSNKQNYVSLFDINKEYIEQVIWGAYNSGPVLKTIPDNVYHVGITLDANDYSTAILQVDNNDYSFESCTVNNNTQIYLPPQGKNLFNKNAIPYEKGKYISDVVQGVPQYSNNAHYNVYRIPIKPATKYTFGPIKSGSTGSGPIWATTQASGICSRYVFNAGGSEGKTHTFTSYSVDAYLLLSVPIDNEYGYKCNDILQVEEGDTITTYEPYEGVYGGYIDLLTGEIKCDWVKKKLTDFTWHNYTAKISYYTFLQAKYDGVSHRRINTGPIYSDILKIYNDSAHLSRSPGELTYNNGYNLWIMFPEAMESDAANAWIAQNYPDASICFQIESPITIGYINPIQLKTLKGTNNIWSSANGPVSIKYWTH